MNQAEKIVERLKICGVTPYKISKDTGISESAIGNYIKGKSHPSRVYTKYLEYYLNFLDVQNTGEMFRKPSSSFAVVPASDHISRLIDILQSTLLENDTQIESLQEIIKKLIEKKS